MTHVAPRALAATLLSLLSCLTVSLSSSPAMAQDTVVVLTLSTTTYGGPTTSAALTTVGIVWLLLPEKEAKEALLHYMNENPSELSELVITGQGAALDDMASLSGVAPPHKQRFARGLLEQREALAPLARRSPGTPYTEQDAALLLGALHHVVTRDEVLRGDLEAAARDI